MSKGFVLIPDTLFLDENLNATEILLLGMIIRLSQKGDCFATNDFFAKKLHIIPSNISRYIKKLEDKNYIQIDYEYTGGKVVKKRTIKLQNLTAYGCRKQQPTVVENDNSTVVENDKDNNTYINKQFNIYNKNNFVKKGFKNYTDGTTEDDIKNIEKIYKKYGANYE